MGPAYVPYPDGEYARGAKWFHWLTVPPVVVLLASGLLIRFIADDVKMRFYTVHESLGLLAFVLMAARLTYRLRNPPPPMAPHIPPLERMGAEATHHLVYALLLVQPVLGFLTTNLYGFPQQGATAFLGVIDLPRLMEASPELALTLHWAHSITGWLLISAIVAHVGGVLVHHVGKRDGTLTRML